MENSQRFYAVKRGRKTGIFTSYGDCLASIAGYDGSEYDVFSTRVEALEYLNLAPNHMTLTAYTDGSACADRYGWGVVIVNQTLDEVSGRGYCGYGTRSSYLRHGSTAGEIIAALKAIEYAVNHGYGKIVIRHDFTGVRDWALTRVKDPHPVAHSYYDIVQHAADRGLEISFQKVKAHTGDWGNECADRLAGQGASGKSLPMSEAGLIVSPARIPPKVKVHSDTPLPKRSKARGPFALLLEEDAEISCIRAIQNLADLLDKMYGSVQQPSQSVYASVDAALRASIPQYEELVSGGRKEEILPSDADPQPGASFSDATQSSGSADPAPAHEAPGRSDLAACVASVLRSTRRHAGLRLADVAAACGLSVWTLGKIERGLMPAPDVRTLQDIAHTVGCGHDPGLAELARLEQSGLDAAGAKPASELPRANSTGPDTAANEKNVHAKPKYSAATDTICSTDERELKPASAAAPSEQPAAMRKDPAYAELCSRICRILLSARRSAGVRRMDVAAACRMDVQIYSRIERGRISEPDDKLLCEAAEALGCAGIPEMEELEDLAAIHNCTPEQYSALSVRVAADLRKIRLEHGIPADTVAESCGISPEYLELAEQGVLAPISADMLRQLADAVDCSEWPVLERLAAMENRLWPAEPTDAQSLRLAE